MALEGVRELEMNARRIECEIDRERIRSGVVKQAQNARGECKGLMRSMQPRGFLRGSGELLTYLDVADVTVPSGYVMVSTCGRASTMVSGTGRNSTTSFTNDRATAPIH